MSEPIDPLTPEEVVANMPADVVQAPPVVPVGPVVAPETLTVLPATYSLSPVIVRQDF